MAASARSGTQGAPKDKNGVKREMTREEWDSHPRYPDYPEWRDILTAKACERALQAKKLLDDGNKEAAIKTFEEAAWLFTRAHLSNLFTHCDVVPAPELSEKDRDAFDRSTVSWNRTIGTTFSWFIRRRELPDGSDGPRVYYFRFDMGAKTYAYAAFMIEAYLRNPDEEVKL